jgi:adenylate kinase family enzyme
MDFIEQFKSARKAGVPLIAIRTSDNAALLSRIGKLESDSPVLAWDVINSVRYFNAPGKAALQSALGRDAGFPELSNPALMAINAARLPEKTILVMFNAHRYTDNPNFVQALWNLRDELKRNERALIISCPYIKLPQELAADFIVLEEPLPDPATLRKIVVTSYEQVDLKPDSHDLEKANDALSGLPSFGAEQACAMSMTSKGLDMAALWERKRQQIETAPGLKVWRGTEKFADLGGLANVKKFTSRIIEGKNQPRAVVFIDEIEKAIAGHGTDMSGTSTELLGELLSFMQDTDAKGMLLLGPGGSGKSGFAKAIGNEATIPTISFNISAMKGSLVGESGANMRNALKVVDAVAQKRALFVGTCNAVQNLPAELKRRFSFGTFFFDLPDPTERSTIWDIYFKKFGLKEKRTATMDVTDHEWTGSEVKNCCDISDRLNCSIAEAAQYINPIAKSDHEGIRNLRNGASGKFLSASYPGVFDMARATDSKLGGESKRRFAVSK